jgi:TonB family protein
MRTGAVLASALALGAGAAAGRTEPAPQMGRGGIAVVAVTPPPAMEVPLVRTGYQPILMVRAGTPVTLRLRDFVSAKDGALLVGERVRLEVVRPVAAQRVEIDSTSRALGRTAGLSSILLVKAGSEATGEIVRGAGGRILLRLRSLRADGRDVRLSGESRLGLPPGGLVTGTIAEDIVPAQPLQPIMVPDFSRARPARPAGPAAATPAPRPGIVTPPRPRAPLASYITEADYPLSALTAGESGVVNLILDVGIMGRVEGCRIARSSGSGVLDSATCRLLRSRARFTPAIDRAGNAAAAPLAGHVAWTLPPRR